MTKLLVVNGQLLISCYEQLKMISEVAIVVSDGTLECLSVCELNMSLWLFVNSSCKSAKVLLIV